ncbi:MAG: hypothetical protein C4519_09340 [Desulfobacteraceae bacterium]|nr:MAG: hypothetical protein C4519_09340 [Desulfobacteraceae bacterium]
MQLNTAAALMAYIFQMEGGAADFYAHWADRLPAAAERLHALARENRKFEQRIRQAYYNAASDALETNFSFTGLTAELQLPQMDDETQPEAVLKAALRMEDEIQAFYERAAAGSEALMPDVRRAIRRVAQARAPRKQTLLAALETLASSP